MLRVFENRVLRGISGPKRDELMGGWRKLHNKELCDVYSLASIIRMMESWGMRWVGHVAKKGGGGGGKKNAYRLVVGKPDGRRSLGPRCRWVDNIKMYLADIGWGGVDWIGLSQDRDKWKALVNAVMNLQVP
jgi:hypothetical protein